jgi:four helix bundle protein
MNDLNLNVKTKYDLAERTERFGEAAIDFARDIPIDVVTMPLISQFIRSGTSVGANYCEADGAESKKDFKHKIAICKKESKETKYWLKMIMKAVPELIDDAKKMWQEAQELTLIFSSIYNKS